MSLATFVNDKEMADLEKTLAKHTVDKLDDPTQYWDGDGSYVVTAPGFVRIDTSDMYKTKVVVKGYAAQVKLGGVPHTLEATQTTTTFEPPPELVLPAPVYYPPRRTSAPVRPAVRLYAVLPDQQVPFYDKLAHELVLAWLRVNKPHGLILPGDTIDFESLSTFDWNPENTPNPIKAAQHGIIATHDLLVDYLDAAGPQCVDNWFLEGNHEYRLKRYLAKHAPMLYALTRPGEDEPLLSLSNLLRLKELGFKTPPQSYPDSHIMLTKKLAIYHGWVANNKSGATALTTMEALDQSCIVGHSHRQSMVFKTTYPADGVREHVGIEAGCLCSKAPGSTDLRNWQRGFAAVRVWDDDTFDADLAKIVNDTLLWQGQRYWLEDGIVQQAA